MDTTLESLPDVERRRNPRIYEPFPATVRGVDTNGKSFETSTVLDNLSASGLYLRLAQSVKEHTELLIVTRLATAPTAEAPGALVALHGVVLRAELQPDGSCGVAVLIKQHRFL